MNSWNDTDRERKYEFGARQLNTPNSEDRDGWHWLWIIALPVIQAVNLWRYAKLQETIAAKVWTIIVFLPVMFVTALIWLGGWMFVIAIVREAVSR